MTSRPKFRCLLIAVLLGALPALAAPVAAVPAAPAAAVGPVQVPAAVAGASGTAWDWTRTRTLAQLGRHGYLLLSGVRSTGNIEFQVRHDRIVKAAGLDLAFTPSPSLLPVLSHLRVYLNDVLMGVVPVSREQLGVASRAHVDLDPRLIQDFNRVRLEFVGHYAAVCEDPAHSSLWVNVASGSTLRLDGQVLAMDDDLANFPLPFFDPRDSDRVEVPMVFGTVPGLAEQRAAAVLASYFGSQAGWWRQARFPVTYGALPASGHAVVFATNDRLPAFLGPHARVAGPVVELASVPGDPRRKLLLILGRDDADLQKAVLGLTTGSVLFRGRQVRVDEVKALRPRKPYDAPNWTRTDGPVRFADLLDYNSQLQTSGLSPDPITLNINLPPDLFIWRNQGIPLKLRYRYTPPYGNDESKLGVSINDQFIASFPLVRSSGERKLDQIRQPVLSAEAGSGDGKLLIPALKIGDRNQIRFDFGFSSVLGSARRDECRTMLPPNVQAAIDEDSTIDFSGFYHYIGLPDLSAFALSGFPFTRMADLSDTVVLMPKSAGARQLEVMLDAVGGLGAQSGYPAFGLRLSDDIASTRRIDADLLVIGRLPAAFDAKTEPALLLEQQRSTLLNGRDVSPERAATDARLGTRASDDAVTRVAVSASAPLAAIVGLQSPDHPQRSVVVLAAADAGDYALIDDALTDTGKRSAIAGAVAIIRSSGIHSQFVGEHYYVGDLPWWLLMWFHLADHPALLAALAALAVVLASFLLWRALRWISRRRLNPEA